jgi:DNA-binding NtrC family response regulator
VTTQSFRTLVIEDEPSVCFFLEEALRHVGHVVTSVPTAEEALAYLEREVPDLMMVDLQLAGMSGMELLELLHDSGQAIPSVVLSAYDAPDNARQALTLGAADFLPKPCTVRELRQTVAWALDPRNRETWRQALADCLAQQPNVSVEVARSRALENPRIHALSGKDQPLLT